jgi:hypothetical protein
MSIVQTLAGSIVSSGSGGGGGGSLTTFVPDVDTSGIVTSGWNTGGY